MKSTPPESDWTAEDLANQRRVSAQIEREIAKMQIKLTAAAIAIAVGIAAAIHFLSTP